MYTEACILGLLGKRGFVSSCRILSECSISSAKVKIFMKKSTIIRQPN